MSKFNHLNESGAAHMVDVSEKPITAREATAESRIVLNQSVLDGIKDQSLAKGDLLATARIAGIQGAKRCADLIPLCHPMSLSKVAIEIKEFSDAENVGLVVLATCKTQSNTGVEMEAMTAASVAALTIYDMCKSADKGFSIDRVRLLQKSGGKSGNWRSEDR